MNIQDRNKSNIGTKLEIVVFLFVLMGCNNTRFINVRCRPLSDYEKIRMVDFRTMETVVFDSTQYRQYLLNFSDTTNNSSISGVFCGKVLSFRKRASTDCRKRLLQIRGYSYCWRNPESYTSKILQNENNPLFLF